MRIVVVNKHQDERVVLRPALPGDREETIKLRGRKQVGLGSGNARITPLIQCLHLRRLLVSDNIQDRLEHSVVAVDRAACVAGGH